MERSRKRSSLRIQNSWLNVLWRGELLDVVLITWAERSFPSRHHWIVADSGKLAKEFLLAVCEWSAEIRSEVLVFQDGEWEKSEELFAAIKTATFNNLVLRHTLKQEIQNDFAQFFDSRETYERYRIPWKRGVLFIGPPGNGKTHTVKALVNQLGKSCLYVKSFESEYATDQENMRQVFARARKTTPCFVVMEDLDSMIDNKNRAFFLNELDGFETNTGVVMIATTNHPDRLDASILDRPSRFDRKYYFHLPADAERLAYIEAWNQELEPELRLSEAISPELVQRTQGFSFAYMKELFVSSMTQWMASQGGELMDCIIIAQALQLRQQMTESSNAPTCSK